MNTLKHYMNERGYTYKSLADTLSARFGWKNCKETLISYGTGRRKLSSASAKKIMELAIVLDDPDQSGTDYCRYMGIMYDLINNETPN